MKKILLIFLIYFISNYSFAQPQWRFYVAFEDALGEKDTLWMIYDNTAHGTLPTDTALGEGKYQFDYSRMNMWIYNYDFDSTKIFALPYSGYPSHALNNIQAFNYKYPLTITWDTSLFHSPLLPSQPNLYINVARIDNDYFWSENNDPPLQAFNMLLDNHAIAPAFSWFSQEHFPMTITFYYTFNPGIINPFFNSFENVVPNPCKYKFSVSTLSPILNLTITNINGIVLKNILFDHPRKLDNYTLQIEDIKNGLYFINFHYFDGRISHKKLIKLD